MDFDFAGLLLAGLLGTSPLPLPATESQQTGGTPQSPAPVKEVVAGESRLRFYGFARLDAIVDDSRPDSFQSPFFILSEDPRLTSGDQANFTLHPRLSRLGMDFAGPRVEGLGGATLSSKIEIDFQNGGRESRAIPRYRHLYLKLTWKEISLLAGQTSDVISPLFPTVNNDSLMWNAGNLGDRRAQFRLSREPQHDGVRYSWAVGLGLTGAVDSQDLDNDGVRDGEASGLPNLQARMGVSIPVAGQERRLEVGISGHLAREETSRAVAGATRFDSSSLEIDFRLPLLPRLLVQGEAWKGKNLSDFRGGIAQDVGPMGQEVESRGGWLEVGIPGPVYSIYLGATRDDPRDEDIQVQGRTRNGAWYLVQRWQPSKSFTVGLDLLDWTTKYLDLAAGEDHRWNLYLIYTF